MKQLLTLLAFALLTSCSKDDTPQPGPPSYPHIFWNPNVTFKDATPVIINGVFHIEANLVSVSDLKKFELIRVDNSAVVDSGIPVSGVNSMEDGSRATLTPKKTYTIKFTRNDNSTFQTTAFEI